MLLTLLWEAGVPLPLDEVAKELDLRLDLAGLDTALTVVLAAKERAAAALG